MEKITQNEYTFSDKGIQSPNGGFLPFKTNPFNHQLQCLRDYGDRHVFAILAEMGTGKSWIVINNYAYLQARRLVQNMLVIAPNGVQWNWVKNELPAHLPEPIAKNTFWAGYSGGMSTRERKEVGTLLKSATTVPCILCMNWDSLSVSKGASVAKQFVLANPKCMIVLDESDYCKNPNAKRTKTVMDLGRMVEYKRIMTGTPITNSPFDAFTQFNFLSPAILNCSSYILFQKRYGVFLAPGNPLVESIRRHCRGVPMIQAKDSSGRPVFKNLDQLQKLIAPVSFRVLKDDCLDLPEKLYINDYVELTPVMKSQYESVKKAGLLSLDGQDMNITSQMAILTQLCQITGNHVSPSIAANYGCQDDVIDKDHNPKLERAIELISRALEKGRKVIVWARYRAEIQDLEEACRKFRINAVSYYGDTNEHDRIAAIDNFQNGDVKVFISNQASGGTGLTLTAASVAIYYSNSFSLHDRLQSEDRCHRIGQKRNVIYINMIARNTVDEKVQAVLDSKKNIADVITSFKSFIS